MTALTKIASLPDGGMIAISENEGWWDVVEPTGNPANPPYVHESCETRSDAIRTARLYARERSADIKAEIRAAQCEDLRQAIADAIEAIESPAMLASILGTINRSVQR